MVKRKLPPRSRCSLEAVEPHSKKGAVKFFLYIRRLRGWSYELHDMFFLNKKAMLSVEKG